MAKSFSILTLCLLFLSLTLGLVHSARILDQTTFSDLPPLPTVDDPSNALPSAEAPAAATSTDVPVADSPAPYDQTTPDDTAAPVAAAAAGPDVSPDTPVSTSPASQGTGASATAAGAPDHPAISFYMHDVLGGSHASGRIVTGLIATENVNGIPFSQPNNQVFPVTNGVPLQNNNLNNLFNNNNVPFVAGLNGQNQQSQTVVSNAGGGTNSVVNGGNNNQAFVTPGQLPSGVSLQKLMFGSMTVIDDELTEAAELGSGVLGRGQGFYLASSLDGQSHTMAFTALFPGEQEDDTISFFGVHRTASPISQIAVIGGTGKYENAKGYATIEALPQQDQHTTDGIDTIAHISVYTY